MEMKNEREEADFLLVLLSTSKTSGSRQHFGEPKAVHRMALDPTSTRVRRRFCGSSSRALEVDISKVEAGSRFGVPPSSSH
jgi:hypothetical protein